MKHIHTFESFLNEAKKDITQLARELVEIAAGYVDVDMTPEMNRAMSIEEDDELIDFLDELYTEVADLSGTEAKKFKKEAVAFLKKYGVKVNESAANESLNEGKMVINPLMDKSVKTPYGKGGSKTTVILGKTSSGLAVTLNADFVDAKKNMYVTEPTEEDREEAMEMIKFHHNRLTGGTAKEKLGALLANGLVKENLDEAYGTGRERAFDSYEDAKEFLLPFAKTGKIMFKDKGQLKWLYDGNSGKKLGTWNEKAGKLTFDIDIESNESELNEDSITGVILMLQAAMLGGQIAMLVNKEGGFHPIDDLKNWWREHKRDKAVQSMIDKLKDDPDVIEFLQLPNTQQRGKWQKLIASKLDSEELKYINSISRDRIKAGKI